MNTRQRAGLTFLILTCTMLVVSFWNLTGIGLLLFAFFITVSAITFVDQD